MSTDHVILVAFTVTTVNSHAPYSSNWEQAQALLMEELSPITRGLHRPSAIESWWIAEDERYDGSDCESAVFVPGDFHDESRLTAAAAREVLETHSPSHTYEPEPLTEREAATVALMRSNRDAGLSFDQIHTDFYLLTGDADLTMRCMELAFDS